MSFLHRLLLAVIALILVGDAVTLARGVDDNEPPSQWDPRLADLARFVEDERNLRYDHPVEAQFLTAEEYEKEAGGDEASLTDQDKEEIAAVEGEMRALGLIDDDTSLFEETSTITSSGTLAFYDPDTDEIVIRGTELTVGLKVTLVHELTHALQDQHFDLSRDFDSDNQSTLFRALGEGDATRIEDIYIDSLSDEDQDAYFDEQDESTSEAESAIEDVSPFITQLFGAPYELGTPLTTIVVESEGDDALNALFRDPPASDELLLDPFALLAGAKPVKVAQPKLRSGEKLTEGGDFGAITWYLMLASRLDEKTAMAATDGWAGDSYVGYRKGGKSCVRALFAGDTAQDTREMTNALNAWKEAFGSPAVTVSTAGDNVELDSCEPESALAPREGSDRSLLLPIVRYQLVNQVLSDSGSERLAKCAVTEFLNRVSVAQLDPQTDAEVEALQRIGGQVGAQCASRGER